VKKLGRIHKYSCLALVPAIFLAHWSSNPSPTFAQEARVAIEPRPSKLEGATGSAARRAPDFRINSDLVLIPVLVTDKQDRLITGLEKEKFKIFDDKIEQVITHFASEDVPVSIAVVLDASGSMNRRMSTARAAIAAFLQTANAADEFSLIDFNNTARLRSGFPTNPGEILDLALFIKPTGQTALLDAIYLALNEMRHARNQRKAILVISDGGDNHSRYSMKEVKAFVREADAQIYSIGIVDAFMSTMFVEEMRGPDLLAEIATQSGGRYFEVEASNELADVASKVGTALRNQYVLGFAPSPERRDGKYHRLQVKIERPKGLPALRASFRAGYVAPTF